MLRIANVNRITKETEITLKLGLDGRGECDVATGVGFFDHMLAHLAKHSRFDLTVKCSGDLHVDAHHTVEDVGLAFGAAFQQALGDKSGIRRYGDATVPMDEALATAAVDLGGRPYLGWNAEVPLETLGSFNSQLAEEFWRAASNTGAFNLHVILHCGRNTHHIIEVLFKAVARALRIATEIDPRGIDIPSTKGVL